LCYFAPAPFKVYFPGWKEISVGKGDLPRLLKAHSNSGVNHPSQLQISSQPAKLSTLNGQSFTSL
jgi:hypothetical protein